MNKQWHNKKKYLVYERNKPLLDVFLVTDWIAQA